ncbi:MAG: gliding motility protein GldM [Bacteroidaceae bacterium]|nr:gliding motility protein GldM [Bacteroidaceae bacterium]
MAIKKKIISPRQKMINLMYVVLMAMLALNVSNDVLKGLQLVSDSLKRSSENAESEIKALYDSFAEQMSKNPSKVKPWYDKAQEIRKRSDEIFNFAQQMKIAIAREADGKDANPDNLINKEDLEAAQQIMLAPGRGNGKKLYEMINSYRDFMVRLTPDKRQIAIISSNLSTEIPKNQATPGKNWQQYMFETMPAIAATTMLTKLQTDVRQAESEVLRELITNIDIKDIRVNELAAYCLPEATTLFPGDEFRSRIFMAAIDTTQRPEIYVNGNKINPNGTYNFRVGGPGEYSFKGYITMPNAAGDVIRREFIQKYNVIMPPSGATVAADMMNVLYAGYNNPVSVSASGISPDKISLSINGGTLTPNGGNGHYIARPTAVGQDVTFNVTGIVNGKSQQMGAFTFKVRKLPDPTAFIPYKDDKGNEIHFMGGRTFPKTTLLRTEGIGAAIDDGLLNISFQVISFETTFFDNMGNAIPEKSAGAKFSDRQREMFRRLSAGKRFYINRVKALGPDGIQRDLPQALEVIVR